MELHEDPLIEKGVHSICILWVASYASSIKFFANKTRMKINLTDPILIHHNQTYKREKLKTKANYTVIPFKFALYFDFK